MQTTLGQYGIQTDIDQLKGQAASAIQQGGTDVLKNLVGTLAEVGGMILDIVLALVISLYLLSGPVWWLVVVLAGYGYWLVVFPLGHRVAGGGMWLIASAVVVLGVTELFSR